MKCLWYKRTFLVALILVVIFLFIPHEANTKVLTSDIDRYQAKYAWASSVNPPSAETPTDADLACDNNIFTRWDSNHNESRSFIAFDYLEVREVNIIVILWEAAYAKVYAIDASDDGRYWREIWKQHQGKGGMELIKFVHHIRARYLRLRCSQKVNNDWGYSVFEFQVFGEH